jgi:Ca2+-transporting ATPase
VRKSRWDGKMAPVRPGGEDHPFAYSSTLVTQGHAIAKVVETGAATEVGKIGKALKTIEPEKTELQKETGRLVKIFGVIGFIVCAIVIISWGLLHNEWVEGFLVGLSLAMSLLPEEFPVVLTLFLALGAWRMSAGNVLTRRMAAIQNLGAATVLCSDKTGTLTENRMTLEEICASGKRVGLREKKLPEWSHPVLEYAALASQKEPFDPMERSIKEAAAKKLAGTEHLHDDWELVREYTLSKELLALSHVWRAPGGKKCLIAAKGAPEAIFDLCHLPKAEEKKLMKEVVGLSDKGLRVLGVARAYFSSKKLPKSQHDFDFEFVGLLALEDPVRPEVAAAVKECHEAGMRVIMITGDYPGTARVVAQKAGFPDWKDIITGAELDAMGEKELRQKLREVDIFARVVPEQKLRIVQAFKKNGEVVVMTGDGVNDAPALKAASIGIAMGNRGTEVARESAALVLTDDNFASIVGAVRMGRRIYDNIRKAMEYIISVHMPIAGTALLPIATGWPIVLYPVHIAFLELVIDPVCTIVFEAEPDEKNLMKRKPRRQGEKLINNSTFAIGVLRGLFVLAAVAFMYHAGMTSGAGEDHARTLAFSTLILGNLALILTSRSDFRTIPETLSDRNQSLWIVFALALFFLCACIYFEPMGELFKMSPLSLGDWGMCAAAAIASMVPFELAKVVFRRR